VEIPTPDTVLSTVDCDVTSYMKDISWMLNEGHWSLNSSGEVVLAQGTSAFRISPNAMQQRLVIKKLKEAGWADMIFRKTAQETLLVLIPPTETFDRLAR